MEQSLDSTPVFLGMMQAVLWTDLLFSLAFGNRHMCEPGEFGHNDFYPVVMAAAQAQMM